MARLNAGDYRPLLRLDAADVRFRFPGRSSWATELRGKRDLERWLQRFVAAGLQIRPDEVVVGGLPWRMTLCVRGTVRKVAGGATVYQNRYVIWGHMAWGFVRDYEVYEDTEETLDLDAYLARSASPAAPPVGGPFGAQYRSPG
jgi:hypothetical protein